MGGPHPIFEHSKRMLLHTGLPFNEPLHNRPRHDLDVQEIRQSQAFSHSLGWKLPIVMAVYQSSVEELKTGPNVPMPNFSLALQYGQPAENPA